MEDQQERLDSLEAELRQTIAAPPADLPAFLDDWLRRLRIIPFAVSPRQRVMLLSDAASQYYFHGQRVFNAVEPIALAVMLAEQQDEQALLRRALSIQGLILTATRNTPDALRSLMRALDIAENMSDGLGIAAAWLNISVTFQEATLYNDARVCFERANAMGNEIGDNALRASLRARALHGVAVSSLYLHEFLQGVEACEEAQELLREPKDREHELVRATIEATYAQLLLALNRTNDAATHAAIARDMAVKSGSARAKIQGQRRCRNFPDRGDPRPVEDLDGVLSRSVARVS
jgi:tetratricopeptide (TPR) repeat protein